MKSTIMIPAYNVGRFLHSTLESALEQTLKASEILIVNDGSTDNTKDVAESYRSKYSEIKVIHQNNQGIGATRKRLLEESKGDILIALDGDDTLEPRAVEKVIKYFQSNPRTGFIYTDQNEINENERLIRTRKRAECHKFFWDLIYHCHFPGHLRSFRKNQLGDNNFDPTLKTAEDWDFLLKILPKTGAGHIPQALYNYKINEQGISISNGNQTIQSSIELLEKTLKEKISYHEKNFKIVPLDAGNNIIYYDHEVNGKSTMNPEARRILLEYLRT